MNLLALSLALLCWADGTGRPADAPAALALDPDVTRPPVANKVPRTRVVHGQRSVDDYDWLRDKSDPKVLAYLRDENTYTAAVMTPTRALQEELYREMVGRIHEDDATVPYRQGGYLYYSRTEAGKQYPILCRRGEGRGDVVAERVLLDLNRLAAGKPYLEVHEQAISGDGRRLAYTTDVTGFRDFTLRVKDVDSGRHLADRVDRVRTLAWAADDATLFYVKDDAAKRPYRLYRRAVGGGPEVLVYEEKDELFRVYVRRSADGRFLLITSQSLSTVEMLTVPADRPDQPPRVLLPREDGHECEAEHRDGRFYVKTNKGAPEFRLVSFPADDPRPGSWRDVVPASDRVTIDDFKLFRGHAAVFEREGGLPALRIVDLETGSSHRVALPERICTIKPDQNPDFEATRYRFRYSSPVTPDSVYEYDMAGRTLALLKRSTVMGGYDPEAYTVEWLHARAPDGVSVPISLVRRKSTPRDGTAPLLLYGYGAYGSSITGYFDPKRLSLLDRGVIYAQAHVRGGGDLGERWQRQGRALTKQNSVTDFIAVAEHLIARKYTSADRLAVQSLSAGGVLIGGAVNRRPDLFKAAVLQGPFVDVVNSMLDPTLPLTVPEYIEWGDPNIKSHYESMKAFCPYSNVRVQAYPSILLMTTLDDSQVMYWEPVKFAAKLRAHKTDDNPLLLKVDSGTGHVGPSGRYDALREKAFVYAFLLSQIAAAR